MSPSFRSLPNCKRKRPVRDVPGQEVKLVVGSVFTNAIHSPVFEPYVRTFIAAMTSHHLVRRSKDSNARAQMALRMDLQPGCPIALRVGSLTIHNNLEAGPAITRNLSDTPLRPQVVLIHYRFPAYSPPALEHRRRRVVVRGPVPFLQSFLLCFLYITQQHKQSRIRNSPSVINQVMVGIAY